MRQVNPPRSAIFNGLNDFKRSRTFWISKGHSLCVYKASGKHTCYPGSVPAGTGISPVPTGTLPGGPRGPLEAIQTRRLCRVDDLGAWVCPDSTKWSRIALCGALTHLRKSAFPQAPRRAQFLAILSNLDKPRRPGHLHDMNYASTLLLVVPGVHRVKSRSGPGVPQSRPGLTRENTRVSQKLYRRIDYDL